MKEVMAFIRPNRVNQSKQALADAGFPSFTCRKVLGRGRKQVNFDLVKDLLEEGELPTTMVGEHLTEVHRLVPKRVMTMIVENNEVEKVVKTLIDINQTGNPGDGKIFILPILENYRIRDGAVDDGTDSY